LNNEELYYFLGGCLTLGENPEFVIRFNLLIDSDGVGWERFVKLSSYHLVTPLLYPKFRETRILDKLPEDLRVYLEEIYLLNRNRNLKILQQIEELNDELNSKGIIPIYMKGAGNLLDALYKDPGERIMADLDLLTSEEDFLKATDIIKGLGYKTKDTGEIDILTCQHYPILLRTETAAGIEVHRLPVSLKYAKLFNYDLIAREMIIPVNNPGCRVLSDRHKAILSFIHSQLSHRGHQYGTVSMKEAYDILQISKRININGIVFPEPIAKKATDYMHLIGRITGAGSITTRGEEKRNSLFLLKHKMNLRSIAFRRLNMSYIQLSAYIKTFFLAFTSSKIRSSVRKKLSSRDWYTKHLTFWRKMIRR
jgi:hypothetical protein